MIQKAELWLYYGQNVLSNSFSGLYYSTYTGKISLWFCDALWKSNPSGCQNGGLFLVIITGLPCCALNLYLSKLHLQTMAVYPYILTDDLLLETDLENNSLDQINIKPCEYISELSSVQLLLLFPMILATQTVTLRSQSEPVNRYPSYFVSKQTLRHNYCPTRVAI